jgi:hypothetical protein
MKFIESLAHLKTLESTFVHVRLGDYEHGMFNAFKLNTTNYYATAMKNNQGPFEIISNDPEKAEELLGSLSSNYTVMPIKSMSETFERFLLSSNGIIANSTFSWWGACIMKWRTPSATIVAPDPWNRLNSLLQAISYVKPNMQANKLSKLPISLKYDTKTGLTMTEVATVFIVIMCIVYITLRMHTARTKDLIKSGLKTRIATF